MKNLQTSGVRFPSAPSGEIARTAFINCTLLGINKINEHLAGALPFIPKIAPPAPRALAF
jgi:hypothetical protein